MKGTINLCTLLILSVHWQPLFNYVSGEHLYFINLFLPYDNNWGFFGLELDYLYISKTKLIMYS